MSALPNGWAETVLGDLVECVSGIGFPPRLQGKAEGDYPFAKVRDISNAVLHANGFLSDAANWVTQSEVTALRGRPVAAGATVFAKIGEGLKLNRRAFTVRPALLDNNCMAVVPDESKLAAKFLYAFMRTVDVGRFAVATAVPSVRRGDIANIRMLLPPMAEQIRIADKLDSLLARVNACRESLTNVSEILKRFRQSVLFAATSGRLTEDWRLLKGLPNEWLDVRLGEIADVQGGVTKDSKKQSLSDEEVPYLRVANVQRGYLDLAEIKYIRVPAKKLNDSLLEEGDVLFNEGGDLDKLGRGWIWENQIPRCSFQNHVFRARLRDKRNQPKYISWWGNSRGLEYFRRSGKQTTNLASINKTMLCELPILLPSPEEQAEIVRRVESLFAFADRINSRLDASLPLADRLTPALLAKAFRGELVPQDPNDEPAEKLLKRVKVQFDSHTAMGKRPKKTERVLTMETD
ncbi:hypothetical protein DIE23_12625 [Burkholderia sp. Bp9143]|uniref:restriction endonuclease subunit S n=1 Tax=Burkholderia sp. Bp9143 TaxID=2184574 RepID=UPI000F5A33C0|nr:restriction endonuclease subunit S [Burkholderia sp. Bp9143]RQR33950.1 hypothetical protein DIE23_12625 [Burkholderia sp. Bp9143]